MAHMVDTMAYAGELPWHGLGTEVSNDLTPVQMMDKAGVNWKVHELPSFVTLDGEQISTGQKSLVRSDNKAILTNVGPNWNPCQNEDAFDFFNDFVMAGDMEMHTAGALNEGKIVWCLAKIKESFDVVKGDQVDSYLLFSNPHQYGKSIDVRFTPIRVVCNNTLTLSLKGKANNGVKVGHRVKFDANQVKTQLGIASDKFAKYKEMAQFLHGKNTTLSDLLEYYDTVFPSTSRKDEPKKEVKKVEDLSRNGQLAYEVLEKQPGANLANGTWWNAFNSVTFVTDHLYGQNENNRLHSQWYGQNQVRKVTAANKAVEMANAA